MDAIWKDTYFTSTESALTYQIKTEGGEVLFSGKAYRKPDGELKINIARLCENYLENDIQELLETRDDFIYVENAIRTFNLTSGDTVLSSYTFVDDWSYEAFNEDLNYPINKHYATNMFVLLSFINSDNQLYVGLNEGDYDIPACGDYALYYLNAHGGWDSFLIEGNVIQTDNITAHGLTKTFNNTTIDFGSLNYLNEISSTYKCNTGLLKDNEAEILAKNLIPSTKIYLHDLKNDLIIPVVMDTKTVDHKSYKNQGKKVVTYSFNLKSSQSKIRK